MFTVLDGLERFTIEVHHSDVILLSSAAKTLRSCDVELERVFAKVEVRTMPVHDATHLSTTHYEALRTRRSGKLAAGILIKCKEEIFYKSYITHWGLLDHQVPIDKIESGVKLVLKYYKRNISHRFLEILVG